MNSHRFLNIAPLFKTFVSKNVKSRHFHSFSESKYVTGFHLKLIHLRLKFSLLSIAVKSYKNPLNWIGALNYLVGIRRAFMGDLRTAKMLKAGGKYYMGLYLPGWNGENYKRFIKSLLEDYKPVGQKTNRYNHLLLAITKKCSYKCEHCYEWENLNAKEKLNTVDIQLILERVQELGVGQVQFAGGEPLLKTDLIIEVLRNARKSSDFWIATSGYRLTAERARLLKNAGLTGVIVSLDHFNPEKHNKFRGYRNSYYWVEEALRNARGAGLLTAVSLCLTREFTNRDNLISYMNLARSLKVGFVQFLEAKAVGHYYGKNVSLLPEQVELTEDLFLRMNFSKECRSYPLITYHAYYQRRQGCRAGGQKAFYVDTNGDINPCPFCTDKTGNLLDDDYKQHLEKLREKGCKNFN